MWVRYEDLSDDTVGTLNKITDFIGIDGFDAFESDRQWSIHERDEKVRNMNDESTSRLSTQQIEIINDVAGDMLDVFGYTRL